MKRRLLDFLCCPDCKQDLDLVVFEESDAEIMSGILVCANRDYFPIVSGIPRMLPSSLKEYWARIEAKVPSPEPAAITELLENKKLSSATRNFDKATKANFSKEWDHHDIGGKTWTMELGDRVKWFFLDSIRISKEDLKGKVLVDAGCGNGSQSVAYTELGLEVLAVDLSTGLEKGFAYRNIHAGASPEKVHFVNADLQNPPFKDGVADIIHSCVEK